MAAPKRSDRSGAPSRGGVTALSFTAKLPAQAHFKKVLLERYQEAITRSRKIGHRVSFRSIRPRARRPSRQSKSSRWEGAMRFPSKTRASPTLNWKQPSQWRASEAAGVWPKLSPARIC
jgi:hypothetical protein